jgi:hypothetical protein
MAHGFVVAHPLEARAHLVLAHEKTTEHSRHAADGLGRGLAALLAWHHDGEPKEANRRIPQLVAIPAVVRFLSVDPMLEQVDVAPWLVPPAHDLRALISWIIVGGESGGGARPMHPDWVRGLRDQVQAAGARLFVKQIGSNHALWPGVTGRGEDPAQWPADLRVQDFPQ